MSRAYYNSLSIALKRSFSLNVGQQRFTSLLPDLVSGAGSCLRQVRGPVCIAEGHGYSLTYEISAKDYQSFVKNVVHPIFKDHDKKEIMSIDFTYTSHKKDGRKVLGLAGG